VGVHQLDAHQLPFEDKSFDVVILYKDIYCLAQPEKFVAETHRVLREGSWKIAVAFHLIPKRMKRKELLKKIFYGKLILLKEEIEEGVCEYKPPERISSDRPNFEYKVLYSVANL